MAERWLPLFGQFWYFLSVEVLFFGLGCHGFWQAVEVYLIGCERFQAGVRPDGVVEVQVSADEVLASETEAYACR